MTRQCSHIGLTLGLTFIFSSFAVFVLLLPGAVTFQQVRTEVVLLIAVDNPAAGQVVWAQFHDHAVLWEDADVVLAHLA
jgi:hypothetical protein